MKLDKDLPLNTEPRSPRPEPPFTFAQAMLVDKRVRRRERRTDVLVVVCTLAFVLGAVALIFIH